MVSIARHCQHCRTYQTIVPENGQPLTCPSCGQEWGIYVNTQATLDHCPVCTCRQFYLQKDFNQAVGCLIMAVGIVLVPWTFGLSLPVFALVDWLLYRKIPTVIVCYRCATEFRGFSAPPHLKPFQHHIGLKYDKYR